MSPKAEMYAPAVSKVDIKQTVLLKHKDSKLRLDRRQEANSILKQITLGKKSMRHHSLANIED